MTPMTPTMTTNAPAQPSSIAMNMSPPPPRLPLPPPLTATTGADDSREGLIDVHQTLPLVSRDLSASSVECDVDR